ncbi:hypothetical protein JCM11251_006263 [Rhodosporidiobolus azoricus]
MLRVLSKSARAAPRSLSSSPSLVASRSAGRLVRKRTPPPSRQPHHPLPTATQPSDTPSNSETVSSGHGEPSTPSHTPPEASTAISSPAASIPVHVPHDPQGVLDLALASNAPWATKLKDLLSVPALIVQRQLEMMNVFLGWEEANKYALMSPDGTVKGYLLEEEGGILSGTMKRQFLKTHRPFRATVISPEGEVLLRVHRPFALINSRIFVSTPSATGGSAGDAKEEMKRLEAAAPPANADAKALTTQQKEDAVSAAAEEAGEVIGEVQQEWHLYKRRYNLFVKRVEEGEQEFEQFARFDGNLLAWDFEAKDEQGRTIGSVNRNFSGFARELFTDTGAYVCSFEAASVDLASLPAPSPSPLLSSPPSSSPTTSSALSASPSSISTDAPGSSALPPALITPSPQSSLPLSHRATLLASAITIDIDYFSRSRGGLMGGGLGGFMPIPIPMGGGAPPPAEAPAGGPADETAPVIGAGNSYDDRPLPPTGEDGAGGLRTREEGVPRGEDGIVPGGGSGQGWGEGDEVMQDPWASETGQEEGGTWSWGDLWGDDGDGGGGGDGGDW